MVTSLRMKDIKMGNRGSKSESELVCKRATSRWFFDFNNIIVRYTLIAGKLVLEQNDTHSRLKTSKKHKPLFENK